MYKDKEKQREAVKQATQRYRAKRKGITAQGYHKVSHKQGITQGITDSVKAVEKILAPGDRLTPLAVDCINNPVHVFRPAKTQSHTPMMVGYVPPKG